MSRYYTCAKCDNLVKENEDCQKCAPKPKAIEVLITHLNQIQLPLTYEWDAERFIIDDDNGTGD